MHKLERTSQLISKKEKSTKVIEIALSDEHHIDLYIFFHTSICSDLQLHHVNEFLFLFDCYKFVFLCSALMSF